jgi:hypothetical protein
VVVAVAVHDHDHVDDHDHGTFASTGRARSLAITNARASLRRFETRDAGAWAPASDVGDVRCAT